MIDCQFLTMLSRYWGWVESTFEMFFSKYEGYLYCKIEPTQPIRYGRSIRENCGKFYYHLDLCVHHPCLVNAVMTATNMFLLTSFGALFHKHPNGIVSGYQLFE
jgi:hypothetical protein